MTWKLLPICWHDASAGYVIIESVFSWIVKRVCEADMQQFTSQSAPLTECTNIIVFNLDRD